MFFCKNGVCAEKNSPEIQKAIDFFEKVCYNQSTMKQGFTFLQSYARVIFCGFAHAVKADRVA